jgi:three-Cys-motif partner protein
MESESEGRPTRKAKDPSAGLKRELYVGRGQTFAKHVLLKQYLAQLAFKVLQSGSPPSDFLYLDAFSGPWQAQSENFEDTSFAIVLRLLTDVRETLASKGSYPRMRAIFVEKDKAAYDRLCQETGKFPRINVTTFNGHFEDVVDQIVATLNRETFLFAFLDPIGWKGIALRRITPLIRHKPSEVLVNVMTNALVRHGTSGIVQESVDQLFGDKEWREEFAEAEARLGSRDAAIVELYLKRLKRAGDFKYVGSTRIRFTDKDRTYFHLAYGTRHPAGMEVFRSSERQCVEVQEDIVLENYREKREIEYGTTDMFLGQDGTTLGAFNHYRSAGHAQAKAAFEEWLSAGIPRRADQLRAELMEFPLVDRRLVNGWVKDANQAGRIITSGGTGPALMWHPTGNAKKS